MGAAAVRSRGCIRGNAAANDSAARRAAIAPANIFSPNCFVTRSIAMYLSFRVALHERAILLRDGLPLRAYEPGSHTAWGFGLSVQMLDTRPLLLDMPREIRAVLPEGWIAETRVGTTERAVLYRDGRPIVFLRPGAYVYWTVDPSVELRKFSTRDPIEIDEALLALIPRTDIVETTVLEYQRALLYVEGRFDRVLDPGRYAFWTTSARPISIRAIDMRRQQLQIAGQELMTRDKVTLRLSLVVDFAPLDPATAPHVTANLETSLYSLVQLAAREHVAAVTLDELLEGRDAMQRFLESRTRPEAERLGVRLEQVGVKDVVLPGEMKALLNRVIEAEKQAMANVILRREEAAATRALANAARVMEEQPLLMRLKELETLENVASRVGQVRLFLGGEGLRALLSDREETPEA
jgi:regulator of protease activity HflC (stomatin/prohibitin superfamily)